MMIIIAEILILIGSVCVSGVRIIADSLPSLQLVIAFKVIMHVNGNTSVMLSHRIWQFDSSSHLCAFIALFLSFLGFSLGLCAS